MSREQYDTGIQQDAQDAQEARQPVAFSKQYGDRLLVHEGLSPASGAWIAGVPVEVTQ